MGVGPMDDQSDTQCQKRGYPTQAAAIGVGLRASRKTGAALRVYRCPACGAWHLTKRRRWFPSSAKTAGD